MKKIKVFIFNKSPICLCFLNYMNSITIEDIVLLDGMGDIYQPNQLLFFKSEAAIPNLNHDLYIQDNKLGDNVIGIYGKVGNSLSWNKGEGLFINLDANSLYEIRATDLKLEIVTAEGVPFKWEEKKLSLFIIVSYE